MNDERSGLSCLKELITRLHLAPDWDGIVGEELLALYDRDSLAALLKAATAMGYEPERKSIDAIRTANGPALLLLRNGHYVCAVNAAQMSSGKVGLFNPRGENGPATVTLPTEQLLRIAEGSCVVFGNLRDFDAGHDRQAPPAGSQLRPGDARLRHRRG